MSIQSTITVNRKWAIYRIRLIARLVDLRDYKGVEQESFEPDYDVQAFVDEKTNVVIDNLDNWTNRMLERVIDQPFFRQSLFDNYNVIDE
jgi:hypothetical protein